MIDYDGTKHTHSKHGLISLVRIGLSCWTTLLSFTNIYRPLSEGDNALVLLCFYGILTLNGF